MHTEQMLFASNPSRKQITEIPITKIKYIICKNCFVAYVGQFCPACGDPKPNEI